MNIKIMRPKIHLLLFVLFCFSVSVFSQTKSDDEKLLQGKWVLEHVSVHEINDPITLNTDSIGIPSELEIKKNELSFVYKGNTEKREYIVNQNSVFLNFPTTSFWGEWAILDNKLYIEWGQNIVELPNECKSIVILSVYKRK